MEQTLRGCVDVTATQDPTKQCLRVEDLSDPSTPWNVGFHVVNTLRDSWKWTCARVDDVVMTDDLYLTVIARQCIVTLVICFLCILLYIRIRIRCCVDADVSSRHIKCIRL